MAKRPDEELPLMRPITEERRREAGEQMAEAISKAFEVKKAASDCAAEFKRQESKFTDQAKQLATVVRTGKEEVRMLCTWGMVRKTNGDGETELVWQLVASDGKVERTEPTSAADRQLQLKERGLS